MNRTEPVAVHRFPAWLGLLLAAALLVPRLLHLRGPIDDPHSWRQCDTAFYSLDQLQRGFDLLHPRVCWLGAHGTLILEFPLTEALAALLYRWRGVDPTWDRVVTLGFFLIATLYLHRIVARLANPRAAWFAVLAYLAFPLSQFYSRSAQPDFAAIAFAHAFLFHVLAAIDRRSTGHALAAAAAGALAALVKAPYLLPVLPPVAFVVLTAGDTGAVVLVGLATAVPALVFLAWRRHVDAVNATAPDWSFLPGYYKEVNPLWWYLGTAAQRLDPGHWVRIAHRVLREALNPVGGAMAIVGLLFGHGHPRARAGASAFALTWGAGFALYVFVFFNLNLLHNYYQLPALAPCAMLIGLGADALVTRLPRWLPLGALTFAAFLVMALLGPARLGYYRVDWLRVEAGRAIAERVPAGDLVVACDYGAMHTDPRLLQRSGRSGWPLAIASLDRARVARLDSLGARWIALLDDPRHPLPPPPMDLEAWRAARVPLAHAGRPLGTLHLYRIPRREP